MKILENFDGLIKRFKNFMAAVVLIVAMLLVAMLSQLGYFINKHPKVTTLSRWILPNLKNKPTLNQKTVKRCLCWICDDFDRI